MLWRPVTSIGVGLALGRYSNHYDQGERINQAVGLGTEAPAAPIPRREPKRFNRRLTQDQIDELEQAYESGATLSSLGDHFGLNRKTLAKVLERRGVSRRYRLMNDDGLKRARSAYESGETLVKIGEGLGVSRDTVRRALLKDGVKMRPVGKAICDYGSDLAPGPVGCPSCVLGRASP